jgi:hypothetical protein
VSDLLIIGGGGTARVETSAMSEAAARLRHAESELEACIRSLASIDRMIGSSLLRAADAPLSSIAAERAMADAARSLRAATERTGAVIWALGAAGEAYGVVEQRAQSFAVDITALVAYGIGRAFPLLLPYLGPVAAVAIGIGVAIAISPGRDQFLGAFSEWAVKNSAVVSDPAFVAVLRLVVASIDDFGLGLVGAPPEMQRLAGDEGLGLVGLATAARVVFGLGNRLGGFTESAVVTTRVGSERVVEPPSGWRDRAERIPEGKVPIRIDRFSVPGEPDRFEVYIAGTQDFSPVSTEEPFDMTSNISGVAGLDSGAERAVRQAMEQAGIGAENPVVLSGHSQGGLVAATIAASGDYRVDALFTLGSPVAGVPVPGDVAWVAVEHDDDLVPATGGVWRSDDAVIVNRRVYDGEPDDEVFAPAHRRDKYVDTAGLLDGSTDRRIDEIAKRIEITGAVGSSSRYDAKRS